MIDMRTALLLLGLASIVFTLLLWLTARKSGPGRITPVLAWAKLTQGTAFFLLAGRDVVPDILSKHLGNSLLFTGCALECIAAWIFTGRTRWKQVVLPALVISLVVMNAGILAKISSPVLAAVASFSVAFPIVLCSVAFLQGRGPRSILALTIGVTDALVGFSNIFRGSLALQMSHFNLLVPDPAQFWAMASFVLFVFINGFGFLLLIKEEDDLQLKKSEERYRTIFASGEAVKLVIDYETGLIVDANRAATTFYGCDPERLLGMSLPEISNLTPEEGIEAMERVSRREHGPFLSRHRAAGGEIRDVEIYASPFELGEKRSIVCIVHDITERKRMEEERVLAEAQLRQAQKMESLGTLAGGIAHDFNNILGIILGYSEMARSDADDPVRVRRHLDEVLKGANRARDLVKQILAFSRMGDQEKRPVQVREIVEEALKMLRASLPSTIEIQQDISSESSVMADPTRIHQVLMNLCTNSAHAMGGEVGVIEVSVTDGISGPESIPPHRDLKPGPHVRLSVRDTGQGIDPSILDRIYDPFFTTKGHGVGTGLGLSVVHGIVKSHGGAIAVESFPGQGTTFHVYFPAIRADADLSAASPVPLPSGREHILVVDDEPALADAVTQMLERLGYRVEFRLNGLDALEAVRSQSGENPFDLVITDMTMPHLTGADLARELFRLRPHPAVLLCTGFSEKMDAETSRNIGIQGFLLKPVALKELAATVRKVLDERTN